MMPHLLQAMLRRIGRIAAFPFRFWRIIAIIMIAGVIVYIVATQVLLRVLVRQREAIHAAGGAITFRDLKLDPVSPEDNAWVVYEHAFTLLPRDGAWSLVYRYLDEDNQLRAGKNTYNKETKEGPLTDEERERFGAFLEERQNVFDMILEAQTRKGCRFRDYEDIEAMVGKQVWEERSLSAMRDLARFTAARAVWKNSLGNRAEAFRSIEAGMRMANDLTADPLLISALVRVACAEIGIAAFEKLLSDGDLPEPLSPGLQRELARFADRTYLRQPLYFERCYAYAFYTYNRRLGCIPKPLLVLNEMKMNELSQQLIATIQEPDFNKRERMLEPLRDWADQKHFLYTLSSITLPAYLRTLDSLDRLVSWGELSQLLIVLKQYKKTTGAYPDDLNALCPDYVKQLPMDPFSGKPFIYHRQADGFILYGVIFDRVDNGGAIVPRGTDKQSDLVIEITR